jgi:FRG domain
MVIDTIDPDARRPPRGGFRGHDRSGWSLTTTLEREFGPRGADVEQQLLWQFVRTAQRLLPGHLIPYDNDAAAWLGLIQHYGGPTRLLDRLAFSFRHASYNECDRRDPVS